jgi:phosphoglycerate dehydrogenase-like enzyme
LHEGNRSNSTLIGSTVGFVGCGGISHHLQALLEPFGTRIVGYDPPIPPPTLRDRGIEPSELEPMFDTADVIFVLAAPTPTSRRLIDARLMKRLTTNQNLIVLSRASVVDFEAMVELSNERGFRFATDVYPEEPIAQNHPVRRSKHGIIVPHLAGALPTALRTIGRLVVDDLEAIVNGNRPTQMQYLTTENVDSLKQTD